MNENKINDNTALINATVQDLRTMVEQSVSFQAKVSPIYENIVNAILNIFNNENELNTMEAKDLMKLLDISSKAQIQPVVELTKLVQSVTALCEQSVLQEKISSLEGIVKSLIGKNVQNEAEVIIPVAANVTDAEFPVVNDCPAITIDDIMTEPTTDDKS